MSIISTKDFLPKKPTIKQITIMALLIAIEVILSRFLAIPTPIIKISLNFLPIVMMAIICGPIYAGIGAAMGDFIGAMLFPFGPYFPGFTLTAFLIGLTYGIFLYKKELAGSLGLIRIFCAAVFVTVLIQLGIETIWVAMIMTGNPESSYESFWQAYTALLLTRSIRTAIMLPIQVVLIRLLPLVTKHII